MIRTADWQRFVDGVGWFFANYTDIAKRRRESSAVSVVHAVDEALRGRLPALLQEERYVLIAPDPSSSLRGRAFILTDREDVDPQSGTHMVGQIAYDIFKQNVCFVTYGQQADLSSGSEGILERGLAILQQLQHAEGVRVPNLECSIRALKKRDWVVQEYFSEGSLANFLSRTPYLTSVEKWWLVVEVLKQLKVLHEKGVWHLDVKTDNFLVTVEKEGRLAVAVSDFGCSKTQEREVLDVHWHSCPHIAPEIVLHSPEMQGAPFPFSDKSDVFQAGLVVYGIFFGPWPEFRKSFEERVASYRQGAEWNRDLLKDVSDTSLRALLEKMLRVDPNQRCSMEEALRDAQSSLAGLSDRQTIARCAELEALTVAQSDAVVSFLQRHTRIATIDSTKIAHLFQRISSAFNRIQSTGARWNLKIKGNKEFPRSVVLAPGLDGQLKVFVLTSLKKGDGGVQDRLKQAKQVLLLTEGRAYLDICCRNQGLGVATLRAARIMKDLDPSVVLMPIAVFSLFEKGRRKFHFIRANSAHGTLQNVLSTSLLTTLQRWELTLEILRLLRALEDRTIVHRSIQSSHFVVEQMNPWSLRLVNFDLAMAANEDPDLSVNLDLYRYTAPETVAAIVKGQEFMLPGTSISEERLRFCLDQLEMCPHDLQKGFYLAGYFPGIFDPEVIPTKESVEQYIAAFKASVTTQSNQFQGAFVIGAVHGHLLVVPESSVERAVTYENPRWWDHHQFEDSPALQTLLEGMCHPNPGRRWTAQRAYAFVSEHIATLRPHETLPETTCPL